MASHLDLEEQEQLEQLKAFWQRWGNPIVWVLTVCLLGYAGWTGWNLWQRNKAAEASVLFTQLEQAVKTGDLNAGQGLWVQLQKNYSSTAYAAQGALLTAKLQLDKGKTDEAKASLNWAAANASDEAYADVARLRLAALQMDAKQLDEALKTLESVKGADFAPLVADRRGDIALLQSKPDQAKTEFKKAYDGMDKQLDYRRMVEMKLASLGVAVDADKEAAQ